jgi:hypothetical protein
MEEKRCQWCDGKGHSNARKLWWSATAYTVLDNGHPCAWCNKVAYETWLEQQRAIREETHAD